MERILTTHVGSLIRPDALIAQMHERNAGTGDEAEYERVLKESVDDVVRRQVGAGIDVVNDGEYGKSSWITYLYERISGIESRIMPLDSKTSVLPPSRDRLAFPGFYAEYDAADQANRASIGAVDDAETGRSAGADEEKRWVCVGPIAYDPAAIQRDIADLKAAIAPYDVAGAFLPVVAPASTYWLDNEYYKSDEEFVYALADALHEEYKAIVDAGLYLQVDDAVLMHEADSILAEGGTWEDYLKWAQLRVEATNHALRGLPQDRIRYHVCWGSWHGPHAFDPPLADVVELILQIDAGAYAIEMANARHEHEWAVFEDVRLPEGKKLIPGVVTHHTNVVEAPELVAQRLVRLANVVGRENVLAGTDCGFAQGVFIRRVHPEIQWAKLAAMAEGARIASAQLWGAAAAA